VPLLARRNPSRSVPPDGPGCTAAMLAASPIPRRLHQHSTDKTAGPSSVPQAVTCFADKYPAVVIDTNLLDPILLPQGGKPPFMFLGLRGHG
jgi:hypothetical protein